jgi:hypothetical protein
VATITLTPADGYYFSVVGGTYGAFINSLTTKITGGTITNSVESAKTTVGSVSTEIAGASFVITIRLGENLAASDIVTAINGAADGNLTVGFNPDYSVSVNGAVITALANLPATGAVTGAYDFFSAITITVPPGDDYVIVDTTGIASALQTKLFGGTITNWDGNPLNAGTVSASLNGGNLVLTIPVM